MKKGRIRNISAAKKAAETGPVFITDRGKPRYVFQTMEAYHAQTGNSEPSFLEVMDSIDGGGDIDFEIKRLPMQVSSVQFENE